MSDSCETHPRVEEPWRFISNYGGSKTVLLGVLLGFLCVCNPLIYESKLNQTKPLKLTLAAVTELL